MILPPFDYLRASHELSIPQTHEENYPLSLGSYGDPDYSRHGALLFSWNSRTFHEIDFMAEGHGHEKSHDHGKSMPFGLDKKLGGAANEIFTSLGIGLGAMIAAPAILGLAGIALPAYMAGKIGILAVLARWAALVTPYGGKKNAKHEKEKH